MTPTASKLPKLYTQLTNSLRLPPGYRAVFILLDVEGYEHIEIRRMCGISAGNSKSQLHKARTKLRRLLGNPNH